MFSVKMEQTFKGIFMARGQAASVSAQQIRADEVKQGDLVQQQDDDLWMQVLNTPEIRESVVYFQYQYPDSGTYTWSGVADFELLRQG